MKMLKIQLRSQLCRMSGSAFHITAGTMGLARPLIHSVWTHIASSWAARLALHSGRASGYAACVVLALAVQTSSFQDRQVHNTAAGKGKQYRVQPFALVTRLDRAMAGTKKLSISELTDNHLILAACACMGASTGALSCSQVPLMLWMSATGEVVACTSLNAI